MFSKVTRCRQTGQVKARIVSCGQYSARTNGGWKASTPFSAALVALQRYSWSEAVTSGLGPRRRTGGRNAVETVKLNSRASVESTSRRPLREWTRISCSANGSPA